VRGTVYAVLQYNMLHQSPAIFFFLVYYDMRIDY